MIREVYLEHIVWDTGNVVAGSMKVVDFYEKYLPQKINPELWKRYREGCMKPLVGTDPRPVILTTATFELAYYGLNQPYLQVMEEERLFFRRKSPRFVFRDSSYTVLTPSQRSMLFALNKAIGDEMANVYKLDVVSDPFCLVFPKRFYTKNLEFQKAVLLE